MGQRPEDWAVAHCICGAFACLRQTGGLDTIRTYGPQDFGACLGMFDGDVAAFFSADEHPDFVRFLPHHVATWHYGDPSQDRSLPRGEDTPVAMRLHTSRPSAP